jgi:hypothetical protein
MTDKIAPNLRRFRIAVASHDTENPSHTSYGIGLAQFDLDRLGLDEGEELWPGIRVQVDGKTAGNFRVLCDGEHEPEGTQTETEVTRAVGATA